MTLRYDFAAGSEDVLTIYCTDHVVDAETGRATETPIDLTGKTVEMSYTITPTGGVAGAVAGPVAFVVRSPQTGDDLGYADYVWQPGELTEGELEAQVTIMGTDLKPHKNPDLITLQIGESIS